MCGMMVPCMMVCGLKTKLVARDFMYGLMEGSMKVAGKTESSMVLGTIHQPQGK